MPPGSAFARPPSAREIPETQAEPIHPDDVGALAAQARAVFAIAVALAAPPRALADLWGYIDDNGRAHFATAQLDARYQLFFKGRTTLDAPPPSRDDAAALERLRSTPLYQRVTASPNVRRFERLIEAHAKRQQLDPA